MIEALNKERTGLLVVESPSAIILTIDCRSVSSAGMALAVVAIVSMRTKTEVSTDRMLVVLGDSRQL